MFSMFLIIDTIDKKCEVAIYDGRDIDSQKWQWRKDTGTEVLQNIQKLLKKRHKTLQNISTIIVNQGPGSYTGTRVGITIANSLGWSLNIPVTGFSGKFFEAARKIEEKLSKNKLPKNHFPTPIYEKS